MQDLQSTGSTQVSIVPRSSGYEIVQIAQVPLIYSTTRQHRAMYTTIQEMGIHDTYVSASKGLYLDHRGSGEIHHLSPREEGIFLLIAALTRYIHRYCVWWGMASSLFPFRTRCFCRPLVGATALALLPGYNQYHGEGDENGKRPVNYRCHRKSSFPPLPEFPKNREIISTYMFCEIISNHGKFSSGIFFFWK